MDTVLGGSFVFCLSMEEKGKKMETSVRGGGKAYTRGGGGGASAPSEKFARTSFET